MKKITAALLIAVPLFALPLCFSNTYAADAPRAQQNKMSVCSKDAKAKGLKGDERKAYMSTCLKSDSTTKNARKEKLKVCNDDAKAKGLRGAARKEFIKECGRL